MLMSTNIPSIFERDRVCPGCKTFKTNNQFNKSTIRCKECCSKYYQKNKQRALESNKRYRDNNKEKRKQYGDNYFKEHYALNPQKYINSTVKWAKLNRAHIMRREKQRFLTDPNYKLAKRFRDRISFAIKKCKGVKQNGMLELLGCSLEQARKHIEHQFKEGMNWGNCGFRGWHIDHIIPCSAFDLTKIEEQKKCFHYTNLQPLWAKDNLRKSNKLPDGTRPK
jgi:hypothetical protein